jgi:outer membrane biosynthesis protein TonB
VSLAALRTALIWHDEVMSDVVSPKRTMITLGVRCVRRFPWLFALAILAIDAALIGILYTVHEDPQREIPVLVPVLLFVANLVWWSRLKTRWRRSGNPTFVIPEVGLPEQFAIVRPGNRGYLLTLGEHMRGTICIDGEERDVADFVRRRDDSDGPGGFRATPIGGRDWGVVDLDSSGTCKLFFQFVPFEEEAPVFFTPKVIAGGVLGLLIASKTLTTLWWLKGYAYEEAAFRGLGLVLIALTIGALFWWLWMQDGEQKASFVFSVALHGALLYTTFRLYDGNNPFVWPGPRELTGNYLVTRLEVQPPPEPPKVAATVGQVNKEEPAAASPTPKKLKTATKGEQGAAGGKGDTERARDPNARPELDPAAVKDTVLDQKNLRYVVEVVDRNLPPNIDNLAGLKDNQRKVGSAGYGPGSGRGGGGNSEGEFVSNKGKIDMGKERPGGTCVGAGCTGSGPREIKVAVGEMSGDPGGLTAEEINRVVKARAGVFRACYQKELNRSPGLSGKLVVKFKIDGSGVVQAASQAGGSSLSNEAVLECVTSNVMRLKFPAKGGIANVTYPFLFSQGG